MLEAPIFIYNSLNFGPAIGEFGKYEQGVGQGDLNLNFRFNLYPVRLNLIDSI